VRSLWHTTVHRLTRSAGRTRRLCSATVVTVLTVAGLAAITGAPRVGAATPAASAISPDEPTASQNNLRDGWDQNEPTLTQSAVQGGKFGRVFKTSVDGQVYSQPLIIGNKLIVSTENDWVYGLNATTGAILWKTPLGTPYHITTCKDLTPNIGVTSTPVYDPNTGSVYVMAMVKEINYEFHLFGVNVSTGAITLKRRIAGSPTNDSHISFQAVPQDQRPGLLLMHGWVYAAFASHCDHKPYAGYVAGVNVEQRPIKTTLWTDEAGVADDQAGIWQSDGGLMSDGSGRIFFTSGNGISPPHGNGDNPPGQLAESVVRLEPKSGGSLQAKQFFSPSDAPILDRGDKDFGAGGPVGLPFGTSTYPHVMVQGGKKGFLYLLNRDDLTGRHLHDNDLFQTSGLAGLWGHLGVFADAATLTSSNAGRSNDYLYYVGQNDYFRAWKVGVGSGDKPALNDQANSTFRFGFGSGSPVTTSNGTNANSAIVWVVDSPDTNGDGHNSWLGAFDATPQAKSGGGTKMREIWSGNIGTSSKFSMAATGNGMVYIGTRDGNVYGFGITGAAALKSGGTATFADTPVKSATTASATVTATRTVTVTGASERAMTAMGQPDPFTIGRVTVTRQGGTAGVKFPVTLHKGDVLRAQVKFAPGTFGGATGAVSFATSNGPGAVSVPLVGDGIQTGLFATSTSLNFVLVEHDGSVITNVPVGTNSWENTSLVNGGDTPVRVTSVTAPTGRYSAAGLPKLGAVIKPGEAIPVQVQFTPTQAGTATGSFTVTTNKGPAVTVTLSGIGLRPVDKFTSVPAQVNFGSIPVGHTAKIWVDITNTGNQGAVVSGASTRGTPFHAQFSIPKGLTVNGTDDLTVPIIFTPHKAGPFHGLYKVTWRDGLGSHSLEVPISGTGVG
jgi:Abnormal spindle-like microcephaly-assoc'd, ASPM-SPD-2-Hydin/PQQ-like domain